MANATATPGNRYEDYISGINKRIKFAGGSALTFYPNALIGRNISGYAVKMDDTANLRLIGQFAESARKETIAADSNGDNVWDVAQPRLLEAKIGDTIDQTFIGRPVFAKYDDEVSILAGTYGNLVGWIREVNTNNTQTMVMIKPWYDREPPDWIGRRIMAATGTQTLLASELGKTIVIPNTATLTINLPALSTVPLGSGYNFLKVGTDATAVTIDGDASETINGATTNASLATNYESATCIKVETASGTFEWLMAKWS